MVLGVGGGGGSIRCRVRAVLLDEMTQIAPGFSGADLLDTDRNSRGRIFRWGHLGVIRGWLGFLAIAKGCGGFQGGVGFLTRSALYNNT